MSLQAGTNLLAVMSENTESEAPTPYDRILLILAPPRSASTAVARIFWEFAPVRYYCHEPFDRTYYAHEDGRFDTENDVLSRLRSPIDLVAGGIKLNALAPGQGWLALKEMTFQVGSRFPFLAGLVTKPVILLIRDPRLCILSRMRRLEEDGQNPLFPVIESGWDDLQAQVSLCRQQNIPYVLVDTTDLRQFPQVVLRGLFSHFEPLGFGFDVRMLNWKPLPPGAISLGGLDGHQDRWYLRTLRSTGLEPPSERMPAISDFPAAAGFREHVVAAMDIYRNLRADPNLVKP